MAYSKVVSMVYHRVERKVGLLVDRLDIVMVAL
jgi:hypothetical protein